MLELLILRKTKSESCQIYALNLKEVEFAKFRVMLSRILRQKKLMRKEA